MRRFYYEDAEKPWEADESLRQFLSEQRPAYALPLGCARDKRASAGRSRAKALDLGMGYGRNAIWLAERGYEVEGWERDGRYVAEAKREARRRLGRVAGDRWPVTGESNPGPAGRLTVRRGDFTRARLRGKWDVIVVSQALHQVKRSVALKVLRKAATLLRPAPRLRSGQAGFGGQGAGRLFLLVKLTSDRHIQRARRNPEWKPVRGEKNTWLRRGVLRLAGRGLRIKPRTPQMILSALTAAEIRRALKGLRVRHWRTVVLGSDWEDDWKVTHTVAEVVAEKTTAKVEKRK